MLFLFSCILLIIGLVLLIVSLRGSFVTKEGSTLKYLEQSYAHGYISKEEFENKKKDLEREYIYFSDPQL